MQATQRRFSLVRALRVLAAPLARAENINVSRIATKFRSIDFAAEARAARGERRRDDHLLHAREGSIDTDPRRTSESRRDRAWVGRRRIENVSASSRRCRSSRRRDLPIQPADVAHRDRRHASSPKRVASTTATDGRGVASAARPTPRASRTPADGARLLPRAEGARLRSLRDARLRPLLLGDPNGGTYTTTADLGEDARGRRISTPTACRSGRASRSTAIRSSPTAAPSTSSSSLGKGCGAVDIDAVSRPLSAGKSLTVSMVSRTNVNAKASDCGWRT
jgi:hypothetical protein